MAGNTVGKVERNWNEKELESSAARGQIQHLTSEGLQQKGSRRIRTRVWHKEGGIAWPWKNWRTWEPGVVEASSELASRYPVQTDVASTQGVAVVEMEREGERRHSVFIKTNKP